MEAFARGANACECVAGPVRVPVVLVADLVCTHIVLVESIWAIIQSDMPIFYSIIPVFWT